MIKIIAYTNQVIGHDIRIQDSEGNSVQSSDANELLQFLNEPFNDKSTFAIKVAWNLDEFIAPLLRKLGIAACRELASPSHKHGPLFYIPSKVLAIHTGERSSYFYHLEQYFPDDIPVTDPMEIAALADEVMAAFQKMGLNPKKLTSPVAIYESEVLSHMVIPTIASIPGSVNEDIIHYAEECTGRLWIQAYQVGHWMAGECWEYDLRASYPYIASKLRSLQYATYAHKKTIDEKADWGFMKGRVTIYDDTPVHHIPYFNGDRNTYPVGSWDTFITLHDYKFLRERNLGDFKIEDGYFIRFQTEWGGKKYNVPVYPLEQPLKRLFNQRGMGGLVNSIAKRISTAIGYGKFLEKHEDGTVGAFYNPPYAAMINSIGNIRVAEFIYKHGLQNDVIHVGVDGVASSKEAKIPQLGRQGCMGSWRLENIGDLLVLSSGRVYHGEKKPQGLNYDQIVSLIEKKPRQSYYTTKLRRRQTLEESIQLGDLNGLGRMKETTSSFDLNLLRGATDRNYSQFPKTGQELLNGQFSSKPIKIVS